MIIIESSEACILTNARPPASPASRALTKDLVSETHARHEDLSTFSGKIHCICFMEMKHGCSVFERKIPLGGGKISRPQPRQNPNENSSPPPQRLPPRRRHILALHPTTS